MKRRRDLKRLAFLGGVALVVLCLWSLLGTLFIPKFRMERVDGQLYDIRHRDLRDNNPLYTDLFLKSIKNNQGYLVLGTSETGYLPNGNYTDFLNADTSLHCGFSVISGAGKTCSCYFPLILSNDQVRGLKLIYFINPSYWCNKLALSNRDYFHRYVSYTAYRRANQPCRDNVDAILSVNLKNARITERVGDWVEYYVDRCRRRFYQDLRFNRDTSKFYADLNWLASKQKFGPYAHYGTIDSAHYDFHYNVSSSFNINTFRFTVERGAQYRYDELRAMIEICRERGVDVTFVVGPYNAIAFQNAHASEVPLMAEVHDGIIALLKKEGAAYIDAAEISHTPGTFNDWQHHSSYGAYLLYLKIKDYVVEKENW